MGRDYTKIKAWQIGIWVIHSYMIVGRIEIFGHQMDMKNYGQKAGKV